MLRHAYDFKLANDGQDTRALRHYLGDRNIRHTVAIPNRFRRSGRTDVAGLVRGVLGRAGRCGCADARRHPEGRCNETGGSAGCEGLVLTVDMLDGVCLQTGDGAGWLTTRQSAAEGH
jgi:hypothetical protein